MPYNNTTLQARVDLANALAKVEAQVRRSVQEKDVHLVTQLEADIMRLTPLLTAASQA